MDFIGGTAFPAPSLWDYLFMGDASTNTAQYSIPQQVESMLASMAFCQQIEEIVPEPMTIDRSSNSGKNTADSSVNTDFVSLSPIHSNDDQLNTEVGSDFISLSSASADADDEKSLASDYVSLTSFDSQTKPPAPPGYHKESARAAASLVNHEEEHNYFYVANGPLVDIVTMQRPKPSVLKSAPENTRRGPSCFSALSHATAIDHCNTVALLSRFYPRDKLTVNGSTSLASTDNGNANSSLISTANKNQKQSIKRRKRPENDSRNVNHLWLTVDEDTYQQLGLIGRRSTLSRKSGGLGRPKKKSKKGKSQRCATFYIIDVDLNTMRVASASTPRRRLTGTDTASKLPGAESSVSKDQRPDLPKDKPAIASESAAARSVPRPPPHSKLWSRLQWALRGRVPSTTVLVVASNNGRSLPIRFPTSCKCQRLRVKRITWVSPMPIPIPTCGVGNRSGKDTLDVPEAQLTLQWFGAICCRCMQVCVVVGGAFILS